MTTRHSFLDLATMDLDDLQSLIWVAQTGSLHAASRSHGVPRSTLRRRLARLESRVGNTLLIMDAQGMKLTPAGELLVKRGSDLIASCDTLLQDAEHAHKNRPTLRLLCGLGNPPRVNAMAATALAEALGDTRLEIDFDARPMQRLRDAHDAVLYWGDPPKNLPGTTRELIRVPLFVQASTTYLGRFGRPESIEQLGAHRVLHWTGQALAWPRVEGGAVPIRPAHQTTDLYLLGCLAGAGLGLALLPKRGLLVDPSIDALETVLDEHVRGEAVFRLYAPIPTRENSAATALLAIIDQVRDQLQAAIDRT